MSDDPSTPKQLCATSGSFLCQTDVPVPVPVPVPHTPSMLRHTANLLLLEGEDADDACHTLKLTVERLRGDDDTLDFADFLLVMTKVTRALNAFNCPPHLREYVSKVAREGVVIQFRDPACWPPLWETTLLFQHAAFQVAARCIVAAASDNAMWVAVNITKLVLDTSGSNFAILCNLAHVPGFLRTMCGMATLSYHDLSSQDKDSLCLTPFSFLETVAIHMLARVCSPELGADPEDAHMPLPDHSSEVVAALTHTPAAVTRLLDHIRVNHYNLDCFCVPLLAAMAHAPDTASYLVSMGAVAALATYITHLYVPETHCLPPVISSIHPRNPTDLQKHIQAVRATNALVLLHNLVFNAKSEADLDRILLDVTSTHSFVSTLYTVANMANMAVNRYSTTTNNTQKAVDAAKGIVRIVCGDNPTYLFNIVAYARLPLLPIFMPQKKTQAAARAGAGASLASVTFGDFLDVAGIPASVATSVATEEEEEEEEVCYICCQPFAYDQDSDGPLTMTSTRHDPKSPGHTILTISLPYQRPAVRLPCMHYMCLCCLWAHVRASILKGRDACPMCTMPILGSIEYMRPSCTKDLVAKLDTDTKFLPLLPECQFYKWGLHLAAPPPPSGP